MAATPTRLMTVDEYQAIPEPAEGRYELQHGELVTVGYPDIVHMNAQWRIRDLLAALAGNSGIVRTEMPYRPLPEHECWGADVAYVSLERWQKIERWLMGAPELVVEILSPSNTASEMLDKELMCLENGACEFWVVDTRRNSVKLSTAGGHSTYKLGQMIPVFFAPGQFISVDAIFAD
jgi:Uma2 family endonuclease